MITVPGVNSITVVTESSVYGAALSYAELGFTVIPVDYQSKKPAVEWKPFQERKPTPEELKRWFDNGSPKNIGVVCTDNLVILDFDDTESYEKFFGEALASIQQATPIVKTGRGYHIWFRSKEPMSSFNVPELKLNVLSAGHFATAPPSIHPTGARYEFVSALKAPQEMLHFAQSIRTRCEKLGVKAPTATNLAPVANKITVKPWRRLGPEMQAYFAPVAEGEREQRAFKLAALTLNELKLPPSAAREWLSIWNQENKPPLELPELEHALETAANGYVFSKETLQPLDYVPAQLCVNEKMEPGKVAVQLRAMFTLATMDDTHEIYYYDDGVYHANGEAVLAKTIQEAYDKLGLDEQPSKHFVSEALGHLERGTYVSRSLFDSNPRVLNLKNGRFDLETLEFRSHDPKLLSLVQLPVIYDKDAACPHFLKFLREVAYPEDINVIQEWFGFCLWKDYMIAKAVMLVGDGGNGKSTLQRVLESLLGKENISSRTLQELSDPANRFARSELFGKMANIHADLSTASLKATGVFKMLTGRDRITAEFKFKNSFTFVNFAKLIFSCNRIPRVVDDDSTAFFRRWILLTFPNTFQGGKDDKNKLAELTTPEELSGILNWAVDGLIRLHSQGWNFSYSRSTEEIRQEYVRKSDPVAAFVMDCLDEKANAAVAKAELYAKFCSYCNQKHLPGISNDAFFKRLIVHIQYSDLKQNVAGRRVSSVMGIQLRPDTEWGKDDAEETQKRL